MSYSDKLKDPRWQRKRLEVMERAEWACQLCGDGSRQLQVHHPRYVKGRDPWDYGNLICLCSKCHATHHGKDLPYEDPFWRMVARDARVGNTHAIALFSQRPRPKPQADQ